MRHGRAQRGDRKRSRASALLLAASLLGAGGCCSCASSPDFTFRAARARAPGPAPALPGPWVRALHLADFGDETCQQAAMASAVADAHARDPFDLAVFPGDLVYDCGPDSALPGAEACRFASDDNTVEPGFTPPADPRFAQHEAPLAALLGPPPAEVWVGLGNHDVRTGGGCAGALEPAVAARRKACLNVAHRTALWRMDGRHYAVDRGPARFLFVDSNLVVGDYGGFTLDGEAAFLSAVAPGCRARDCAAEPGGCDKPFCFVIAHHPAVTAGSHGDQASGAGYRERVDRLLEAGGGRLRAWLSGHDHDLQHLRSASGLDVFVSGNGARGRGRERFSRVSAPGAESLYGSVHWGYGILEVGPAGWRYRFESEKGAALYCCAAQGGGACEPTSCRPPAGP